MGLGPNFLGSASNVSAIRGSCSMMRLAILLVLCSPSRAFPLLDHAARVGMLNQTNFRSSSSAAMCDPAMRHKEYLVPLGTCYNPAEMFDHDPQWGNTDVL